MAEAAVQRSAASLLRCARSAVRHGGKLRAGAVQISRLQRRSEVTAASAAIQDRTYESDIQLPSQTPLPSPPRSPQVSRRESIQNAKPFSSFLTDNFNREHDYLRISITERCNLRCLYCMPEEGVPLSPPAHLLTSPEIIYLSSLFVHQGVTKIRLTGGEPTIRKDIVSLMRAIGELRQDGLKELCLTTNGISLHRKLDSMVESGLTGVNLSLDTLDPFQFQIMTRRKGFHAVWKSVERILEMNKLGAGIKLKINCVVMRGINEREIIPFVELGRDKDIEVRFIEYMPFDGNKWTKGKMLTYEEMLAMIREKYPALEKVQDHRNDTSKTFRVPGFVGKMGFITSMTHNFCGTCNRLRITSDGNLKVCLFGNTEVSLRDLLRKENDGKPIDEEAMEAMKKIEADRRQRLPGSTGSLGMSEQEMGLLEVIGMAVKRKAAKHAGLGELENLKNRPMILIAEASLAKDISKNSSATSNALHPLPLRKASFVPQSSTFTSIPTHLLLQPTPNSISYIRSYSTGSNRTDAQKPPTPKQASTSTSSQTPLSLPHLTSASTAHMIPIDAKPETRRSATAETTIIFSNAQPYTSILHHSNKKGDVLAVARIAGIQAAKKCPDLIPLAHPIAITGVDVDVELLVPSLETTGAQDIENGGVKISATVSTVGRTGVEMEALTAAQVAALTVYDMCKSVDKGMVIGGGRVVRKEGGRSGTWVSGRNVDGDGNP